MITFSGCYDTERMPSTVVILLKQADLFGTTRIYPATALNPGTIMLAV